ncbi:MAG: hypothetical protein EOP05_05185 [Proteobacteria bacterium]|nr:MAG: hypothetical protein EOP05_05185 [Pseudomonadota bacterium]
MAEFQMTPSTIFLQSTESIDHYLELAGKPKGFKDPGMAAQFRAELFHLEGWARIHRNWPVEKEREIFEKIRKETKTLEDVLGRVDLLLNLLKEAEQKKSDVLIKVFSDDLKTARRGLKHILKKDGWFDKKKSRTDKFRNRLSKIEWPSDKDHYAYLAKEIVTSIGHLQRRFEQEIRPELSKPLTHEILEHDVHEFRREIRWFAIYFQTGQGLFALSPMPKKLSVEDKKLVSAFKDSPFIKLPSAVYTKGWLSPLAYIELTRLIQIIGEIKDKAEKFFFMKEGLMKAGVAEPLAHQQAVAWYGDVTSTTVSKMQEVVDEYERKLPLKQISQDLAEGF